MDSAPLLLLVLLVLLAVVPAGACPFSWYWPAA
jgi:hypothetical protein